MKERDDEALTALSKLRRQTRDSPALVNEFLEIKASIMLENTFARDHFPGLSGLWLHAAQYVSFLTTWARFKRLAIGCCVMFFQQFMGCNAMIYYAPTIFAQLGLDGNTVCDVYTLGFVDVDLPGLFSNVIRLLFLRRVCTALLTVSAPCRRFS